MSVDVLTSEIIRSATPVDVLVPTLPTQYAPDCDLEQSEAERRRRLDGYFFSIQANQQHWYVQTGLTPPSSFLSEVAILKSISGDGPKQRQYGDLATYIAGSIDPGYCEELGLGNAGLGGQNYIEEIKMFLDMWFMFAIATNARLRNDVPQAENAYYSGYSGSPPGYGKDGMLVGGNLVNADGVPIVRVTLHLFPNFLDRQHRVATDAGGLLRRKGAVEIERLLRQPGLVKRYVKEYMTIAWGMYDEEGLPWTPVRA
jgi:hypothetical protein